MSFTLEQKNKIKNIITDGINRQYDSKGLLPIIKAVLKFSDAASMSDYELFYDVLEEATDYINTYPGSFPVKCKIARRVKELLTQVAEAESIPECIHRLDNIPIPEQEDIGIEIIKSLHDRNGVTKADLAEQLNVSTKTIQTYLKRIADEPGYEPYRIGGQEVKVPIEHHKKEARDKDLKFYTPNTMHPLIFQSNLMEVATMLQGLCYAYNQNKNLSLDIAITLWEQLSQYARDRIKEIFVPGDDDFEEFIDLIEEESNIADHNPASVYMDNDTPVYRTERQVILQGDITTQEELLMLYKGGEIGTLVLKNPERRICDVRIVADLENKTYSAIYSGKSPKTLATFTIEEFKDFIIRYD